MNDALGAVTEGEVIWATLKFPSDTLALEFREDVVAVVASSAHWGVTVFLGLV